MQRLRLVLGVMAALVSGPMLAQDRAQTLADIKTELGALMGEFTALKAELVATGGAQTGLGGGDALQRLDAIEAAIARLTAQSEAVEIKVNRVVTDGTNRLGDLEFRLCEATEGCDPMALGETAPLGAGAASESGGDGGSGDGEGAVIGSGDGGSGDGGAGAGGGGVELAIGERRDFDRAVALNEAGDFAGAAAGFAAFTQTYPGSPLLAEVHFKRGAALALAGDKPGSARAYLDAFSADQVGEFAAEALLKLGVSLGELGQGPDACVTLAEVGARFPASVQAGDAATAMAGLGCQ